MATTVADVRKQLEEIGIESKKVFDTNKDLLSGALAVKAFNGAINAAKTQLIYKRMTGAPETIEFFESNE